jgi:hypothetical protein
MSTLTLNPAALQRHSVVPEDLQRPHLSLEAKRALGPLLQSEGFDLTSPIRVRELPLGQRFYLTQ